MKRRISSVWYLLAALLVLTALAAGCAPIPAGPAQPPAPAEKPAEAAKIILRVGTGDSGEGLTPHQEIISRFEKANPDILVQLEAVAGSDYYARLLTQIAAKRPPDIMQIGDDAVPMFVDKGAFVALDDYMKGQDRPGHEHLPARPARPRPVERQAVSPAQGLLAAGRLLQQEDLRPVRRALPQGRLDLG